MYTGGIKPYKPLILLLEASSVILASYIRGDYGVAAAAAIALLPLAARGGYTVFLSAYASSIAVSSATLHPAPLALSTLALLLGYAYYYERYRGTGFAGRVTASVAAFTPLYIAYPAAFSTALTALGVLAASSLREQLRLSGSRVEVSATRGGLHPGDEVVVKARLMVKGEAVYRLIVDGVEEASGVVNGAGEAVYRRVASGLGRSRLGLVVELRDPRGLASITHGPYVFEYTVTPRLAEAMEKARAVLARYAEYLEAPLVLRVLVEPAGTGGAAGSPGGGSNPAAPGAGVPGYGATVALRARLATPLELVESIGEAVKAYRGEYTGVREYQPGDPLRLIHWKKTLSREGGEGIYVKQYAVEGEGAGMGGGGDLVVVADLTSVNPVELDLLLHAVYSILLSNTGVGGRVFLYVKTPGKGAYVFKGRVLDVVLGLNTLILREGVEALYRYEAWGRTRRLRLGESTGFPRLLEDYYAAYGGALASVIRELGAGEGCSVRLVYSKALGLKYSVVAGILAERGFRVAGREEIIAGGGLRL